MKKINLAEKFSAFSEHWSPEIVAALNGQHAAEDELFLVVRGSFRM
jgi:hypothetical protein